jgi:hypothetical protein
MTKTKNEKQVTLTINESEYRHTAKAMFLSVPLVLATLFLFKLIPVDLLNKTTTETLNLDNLPVFQIAGYFLVVLITYIISTVTIKKAEKDKQALLYSLSLVPIIIFSYLPIYLVGTTVFNFLSLIFTPLVACTLFAFPFFILSDLITKTKQEFSI